uniref:Thymidine kinase n=1 Tax=Cyprinid herpesvirus 3 TaxID=180230 RepID=A0A3G1VVR5_CYHV3|nr:thymidine kinase [Cyprinid herpesvirus 3]
MAMLELVIGPMFAGKSTESCRRLERLSYSGRRCIAVKHAIDQRYTEESKVAMHSGATYPAISAGYLYEVMQRLEEYDAVAVDEGQFFPDLYEGVVQLLTAGKYVIVAALDGDFMQQPFKQVTALVPMADKLDKLTAVCMKCKMRDAPFTVRISQGTDLVQVGGAESYQAVCRPCLTGFRVAQYELYGPPPPPPAHNLLGAPIASAAPPRSCNIYPVMVCVEPIK